LTETPTEIATLDALDTAEPTASPSETATPEWTATATASASATATASATPPLYPTEPALTPLFTDTFDTGELYLWQIGAGWVLTTSEGGQALQVSGSDEPVTFVHDTLLDVAVQMRVQLAGRMARLSIRQSAAGAYTAVLSADGSVTLFRGDTVLGANTSRPVTVGEWHTLRLSAVGGLVRVALDGVELIAAQDADPLPAGTLSFASIGGGEMRVDEVGVWIETSASPVVTSTLLPTLNTLIPEQLHADNISSDISLPSMIPSSNYDYVVVDSEAGIQAAITEGNSRAGQSSLPYRIFIRGRSTPYNITQLITVVANANIHLIGMGSEVTILDANVLNDTLLYVIGRLELHDLTLTGGQGGYGFVNNTGYGGVIVNTGTVKVNRAVLRNNSAGRPNGSGGGAIWNYSGATLEIKNTIFSANSTSGGGGAIQNNGSLDIQCTSFESNSAGYGGAISNINGGETTIQSSKFVGNQSTGSGGGVY
jgi:hypothetical protein